MSDLSDLRFTIIPKSDQLNAEQLLAGPMTVTVTGVSIGSDDQPLVIHHDKDKQRPFKPCKTMRKLLIFAWGEDGRKWTGQSMTLYNDPNVRFGGAEVGGIRISHMTGIERTVQLSLTATKGKKALHTVQPLVVQTITLPHVLKAIEAASTPDALKSAGAMASSLSDDDKAAASAAYKARVQALKAAQKKPAATLEQRKQMVSDAATREDAMAFVEQAASELTPEDLAALTAHFEAIFG